MSPRKRPARSASPRTPPTRYGRRPPPAATPTGRGRPDATGAAAAPLRLRDLGRSLLVRAAHPRQALLTALGAGRRRRAGRPPAREVGLVLGHRAGRPGDPRLAQRPGRPRARRRATSAPASRSPTGLLDPGTVWFASPCAAAARRTARPSSNGVTAGCAYLARARGRPARQRRAARRRCCPGCRGRRRSRSTPRSCRTAAGAARPSGDPARAVAMTVLAALLGVGVHFLRALPGLVPDNEDGLRHLPLRIALRIGAPRLLVADRRAHGAGRWSRWSVAGPSVGLARRTARRSTCSRPLGCRAMQLRRSLALASPPRLRPRCSPPSSTSCGFDYATDRVYTPGRGHQRPRRRPSTCSTP